MPSSHRIRPTPSQSTMQGGSAGNGDGPKRAMYRTDRTSGNLNAAKKRLDGRAFARILARIDVFAQDWRDVLTDAELGGWQLGALNQGQLKGCKVMHFRQVINSVHYRVAYRPVPDLADPRLVFIEIYTKEDQKAALGRIAAFVRRNGYC